MARPTFGDAAGRVTVIERYTRAGVKGTRVLAAAMAG